MTDQEKLKRLIENTNEESLEGILSEYLEVYCDDFSALRVYGLINLLNQKSLYSNLVKLEKIRQISQERAGYLKLYLDGDMWATEADARANLQPQIDNAQKILDVCEGKIEKGGV